MNATCVRCGLEQDAGELTRTGECALPLERRDACKDRELSNLRSLLRSVTGKLEEAAELLADSDLRERSAIPAKAAALIDSVLEVLS